jgi:hypothetical protein
MNFDTSIAILQDGRVRRVILLGDGAALTYGEVVAGWRGDAEFRRFFIGVLGDAPYDAYFWETPPVTRAGLDSAFECILADSPALAAMPADSTAFAEHFSGAAEIAGFWNLGRDAYLVAPNHSNGHPYPHLAAFTRTAPKELQHQFWRAVGDAVSEHLSERPLWLSTSGLGIAWLHVRLDTRPKYYTHQPYREAD